MSKRSARKRRVKRTVSVGKVAPEAVGQVEDLDGRIEAIQWLIPSPALDTRDFRAPLDPVMAPLREHQVRVGVFSVRAAPMDRQRIGQPFPAHQPLGEA